MLDGIYDADGNFVPATTAKSANGGSKGDDAKFVDLWNDMAARCGLPKCQKLTNGRKVRLHARLKDVGIEGITRAIRKIESNTWMHGQNERGWKANPDFMLQESSFTKLIEGAYDHEGRGGLPDHDPYRGVEY